MLNLKLFHLVAFIASVYFAITKRKGRERSYGVYARIPLLSVAQAKGVKVVWSKKQKQWDQEDGARFPWWIWPLILFCAAACILGQMEWMRECVEEEIANGASKKVAERRCRLRAYERSSSAVTRSGIGCNELLDLNLRRTI